MSLTQPFRLRTRYLASTLPSPHLLLAAAQLLFTLHISRDFAANYAAKPILTTMVLNACLNGLADTLAQTVTAVRAHRRRQRATPRPSHVRRPSVKINLDAEKLPAHNGELAAASAFDVDRLLRFMAWGMVMAPVQLRWFALLGEWFPVTAENATSAAIWRMLCDQAVFAPLGIAGMFVFMTVCEMGGRKAVMRKLEAVFLTSLKSNYVLWPAVQIINFRLMPLALQIPFASTVGILWTTYLSLKNDTTA